jgi:hypothetical protein
LCLIFLLNSIVGSSQKQIPKLAKFQKDTSEQKINFKKIYAFVHPNYQYQKVYRNYFGIQKNMFASFTNSHHEEYPDLKKLRKFSRASFFAVDAYTMSEEKAEEAKQYFKPILDSIFLNAKNDTTLHANIVVIGYTDEEKMSKDDITLENISMKMNRPISTVNAYKNSISYLRAETIANMIEALLEKEKFEFNNYQKVLIDVIALGRGSMLPESNRSYQDIDEKRRIVKLYWQIY